MGSHCLFKSWVLLGYHSLKIHRVNPKVTQYIHLLMHLNLYLHLKNIQNSRLKKTKFVHHTKFPKAFCAV